MHTEGDEDELEDLDCLSQLLEDVQSVPRCIVILSRANPPRRLFEGGVYFTQRLQLCSVYSRAASIRGRRLFVEIRYVVITQEL